MRFELVTAGESFDDFVFYDLPRLPRPGEELRTSRFARAPGGGAIITAVAAARLGARVAVISAASGGTRARLRDEGITLRNLMRPGDPPAVSVAMSTARDRAFVTYNGVNDRLEARLLAAIPRLTASHVHCALSAIRCRRWVPVVRALQRSRRTVSWDFGWNEALARDPGFAALVAALDLVFLNDAEARFYAGRPTLAAALGWWRRTSRAAVVKLGRRGAVYVSAHAVLRSPGLRVRVMDTTGAGDAFNGGYLSAYVRGADAGECLMAGNRAGARATTHAGGV